MDRRSAGFGALPLVFDELHKDLFSSGADRTGEGVQGIDCTKGEADPGCQKPAAGAAGKPHGSAESQEESGSFQKQSERLYRQTGFQSGLHSGQDRLFEPTDRKEKRAD